MKNKLSYTFLLLLFVGTLSSCNKKKPPFAYFEPISPAFSKITIEVDGTANEDGAEYIIDWKDGTKDVKILTTGSTFTLTHDYSNFLPEHSGWGNSDEQNSVNIVLTVESENGLSQEFSRTIDVIIPAPSKISYEIHYNGNYDIYSASPTFTDISSNRILINENAALPNLLLTCPKAVGTYRSPHSSTGSSLFLENGAVDYSSYFGSGSGIITVTEANSNRIKGTFSGECFRTDGQPNYLDIRNGTFNIVY
jgi:hypothetical protein